ncbi:MAG: tRNA ligase subunit PheS family protein, partial [Acidimicrobiales bacterium]
MTPAAGAEDGGDDALDVDALVTQAERGAAEASTPAELRQVESELLGKRSALSRAQRALGTLLPDERRVAGQRVQHARERIGAVLAERRLVLEQEAHADRVAVERLDLTEVVNAPTRGHVHIVQRTRDELEDVFVGMGFAVVEGPEVETDWYNFEALNMPPAHPARGMWDTFYLDLGDPETVMLRTHTSPVQIRLMHAQAPPIYAVMPGRCYRRDTPDARHIPIFHQLEGLVVDRGIT